MEKGNSWRVATCILILLICAGIVAFFYFSRGEDGTFDPSNIFKTGDGGTAPKAIPLTTYPEKGLYLDFVDPVPSGLFYKSDGVRNTNDYYNCIWDAKTSDIIDGKLSLWLEARTLENNSSFWYAPELFTSVNFHYGLYEASIKVPHQAGVVTFFGTYDHASGDEIDIEFNGSKPNEVELNYWSKGKNAKGHVIKLGFDATAGYHTYAFDWRPEGITWYVDGEQVWSTTYKEVGSPVNTPSPIIINLWPGSSYVSSWLGAYLNPANPPANRIEASFDWIRFTPHRED